MSVQHIGPRRLLLRKLEYEMFMLSIIHPT